MPTPKKQNHAPTIFGDVLLDLRKKRLLTQAEFAVRIGVPKSTYVAWERSEADPPLRLATMVKEFIGVRAAAELVGLLDESEKLPRSVDWATLANICVEVEQLLRRAGYRFDLAHIVQMAGIVYERGEGGIEQGLRDVEELLRIGRSLARDQ